MRTAYALLFIAVLAYACQPTTEVPLPAIVVDAEHSQLDQESAGRYLLPETDRFIVDASSLDFSEAPYADQSPNSVQLVVAEDQVFSADLPASRQVLLDDSSLTPLRDSGAFRGLRAGQTAIIAVGVAALDEPSSQLNFKVQWVGMVEVENPASQP